jgi:hypothetical protein
MPSLQTKWVPYSKDPESFDPICMKYFLRGQDCSLLYEMRSDIHLLQGELCLLKVRLETQDFRFYRETEIVMDDQFRAKIKGLEKQIKDLEECELYVRTV